MQPTNIKTSKLILLSKITGQIKLRHLATARYYEVGAGIACTFMRSIGPEPWHTAMCNPHGALPMAVMVKTPTASSIIINSR